MTEWLTTGQMIDRLKVGEVAESNERADLRVKHTPIGILYVNDEGERDKGKGIDGYFFVNGSYIKNMKWRILPNYVSFEEAMKALKEGKVVAYRGKGGEFKNEITPTEAEYQRISCTKVADNGLLSMFEGKWTIEDDTP